MTLKYRPLQTYCWAISLVIAGLGLGCGFRKHYPPPPPVPTLENFVDNSPCTFYDTYTSAERLRRKPFRTAKKIELVSFESPYEVLGPDSVVYKERRTEIPKQDSKIDRSQLKEILLLTRLQTDSLTNIFFNFDYGRAENGMIETADLACYYPRHAILFYKKKADQEPFAYFEVCLECQYVRTFPKQYKLGNFCEGKYAMLRAFFRQTGIQYGVVEQY